MPHRSVRAPWIAIAIIGSLSCSASPAADAVTTAPIVAVALSPTQLSVRVGETMTLTAAVSVNGSRSTQSAAFSSADPAIATVSASGLVQGVGPGTTIITAIVSGAAAASAQVVVSAGPVASLVKVAGDGQTAAIGEAVLDAPSVRALDSRGNAVSGVVVSFSTSGTVGNATAVSDASGIASAGSWRLGSTAGQQILTAAAAGAASVTFSAMATLPLPSLVASSNGISLITELGTAVAVTSTVNITSSNATTPINGVAVQSVAYGSGTGWLTVTLNTTSTPAVATLSAKPGTLSAGTYAAHVLFAGTNASNALAIDVAMVVSPAAAATRLAILTQPTGGVAGNSIAPAPSVRFLTAAGTTANTNASVTVTINGGGLLLGATTVAAQGGIAEFPNVSPQIAGTFTLTFSSPGLASITSGSFTATVPMVRPQFVLILGGVDPQATTVNAGELVTFLAGFPTNGPTPPSGTVQLRDDGVPFGAPVTLSNGTAVFSTSGLAAGIRHAVSATYSGDALYTTAVSNILSVTVRAKPVPAIQLTSSANPSHVGNTVTFSVNVGGFAFVSGTVQLMDGATALGPVLTLVNGFAAYSTSSLSAAGSPHSITAQYSGDATYAAVTSTVVTQVVTP